MLVDTHAHLNFKAFKDNYREAIKKAFDAEVLGIINVGSNLETSKKALEIAGEYEKGIYAALGIHPTHIGEIKDLAFEIEELKKLAQDSKVVAIGEAGLDYFHDKESREEQIVLFKELLNLGRELNLPLIIHCREAFEDTLDVLKSATPNSQSGTIWGVVHCFSGSLSDALEILDLGLFVSFTGNITYPNAENLREVVREIPLEKIMVETDSPFLAPIPYRGERNEPSYVVEVAKKIAQIKEISFEKVAEVTTQNAQKIFKIKR